MVWVSPDSYTGLVKHFRYVSPDVSCLAEVTSICPLWRVNVALRMCGWGEFVWAVLSW